MQHRRLPFHLIPVAALLLASGCSGTPETLPFPTAAQPCPQWVAYPLDIHSNMDSPLLGCTNDQNIRASLVDPADIDHGRPLGPADGERAARAVEAYRQDKVKSGSGAGSPAPSIAMPGSGASGL